MLIHHGQSIVKKESIFLLNMIDFLTAHTPYCVSLCENLNIYLWGETGVEMPAWEWLLPIKPLNSKQSFFLAAAILIGTNYLCFPLVSGLSTSMARSHHVSQLTPPLSRCYIYTYLQYTIELFPNGIEQSIAISHWLWLSLGIWPRDW